MILALVWWVSHHYVRCADTCWRLTTWEKAKEAEQGVDAVHRVDAVSCNIGARS